MMRTGRIAMVRGPRTHQTPTAVEAVEMAEENGHMLGALN
jgi:hypothetical protein